MRRILKMDRVVTKVKYQSSARTGLAAAMPIRGVLFDMDGTLTVPAIDFAGLRAKLGVPRPLDILVEVEKLDPIKRKWAHDVIEEFEAAGRANFSLQPGTHELFTLLDELKLPRGILTRNSQAAIDHMIEQTGLKFDLELSREFTPFKPAPDGAIHFCKMLGLNSHHCLFVGDSEDDMECGRKAGMVTVLLDHGTAHPPEEYVDIRIKTLVELENLIREGFHVDRSESWPHHAEASRPEGN